MASDDTLTRFLTQADTMARLRVRESEERISGDVYAAALSRKFRRLVVVAGAAGIIAIAGTGLAVGEGIHINEVQNQQQEALHDQTVTLLHEMEQQNVTQRAQIKGLIDQIQSEDGLIAQKLGVKVVYVPVASNSSAPTSSRWRR